MSLEDRIEILENRAEITELVYNYSYTLDDQNWRDWADLFTEDATGHFDGYVYVVNKHR